MRELPTQPGFLQREAYRQALNAMSQFNGIAGVAGPPEPLLFEEVGDRWRFAFCLPCEGAMPGLLNSLRELWDSIQLPFGVGMTYFTLDNYGITVESELAPLLNTMFVMRIADHVLMHSGVLISAHLERQVPGGLTIYGLGKRLEVRAPAKDSKIPSKVILASAENIRYPDARLTPGTGHQTHLFPHYYKPLFAEYDRILKGARP